MIAHLQKPTYSLSLSLPDTPFDICLRDMLIGCRSVFGTEAITTQVDALEWDKQ
jgi:hypothetical protein